MPGVLRNDVFVRLLRARDYLHAAYDGPLSVPALAAEADFGTHHFLRVFRQAFGATPGRYLTQLRVERAKELLRHGQSVTEACFAVGFSSLGSFSTLFAREVGCTPSEYRRRARILAQIPDGLVRPFVPFCFASRYAIDRNSEEAPIFLP
ncbi:MAG TPA: AraC family transcriptional regulator [Polyangiaceae bacterium]